MLINKILGILGISAKAGKIVSGTDIVLEKMEKKKIKLVIVASDSAERTIKNFKFFCEKYKVPIIIYGTIEENSKAIGKVNKAVIGVQDENLAEAIKNKISAEVK